MIEWAMAFSICTSPGWLANTHDPGAQHYQVMGLTDSWALALPRRNGLGLRLFRRSLNCGTYRCIFTATLTLQNLATLLPRAYRPHPHTTPGNSSECTAMWPCVLLSVHPRVC